MVSLALSLLFSSGDAIIGHGEAVIFLLFAIFSCVSGGFLIRLGMRITHVFKIYSNSGHSIDSVSVKVDHCHDFKDFCEKIIDAKKERCRFGINI